MASAAAAAENPGYNITGLARWMIVLTACLAAMLEVVDTSIVNVALADMESTYGATISEIGWVVSAYAIANVIIIPLSAWLGDYFGKKRYFMFAIVGFTVSSVLCGLAPTLPLLVLGRFIQGLAGGGLLAKAQSILFETFPPQEQGRANAIFGIGVIAGPALGPVLGGYITTNWSWPWIFFVNVPLGILAFFMASKFLVPDEPGRKVSSKVDFVGIGLLVITLGCLQYVMEEGNSDYWFESRLITNLAIIFAIGLATFIWWELRVPNPAVNLRVLRHRSLAAGSIFSAVLGMGLYGAVFALPIFTQTVLGLTAEQTGFILLPGALASGFMMPILGRLVGKIDIRYVVLAGGCIFVTCMAMLSGMTPQTGEQQLFLPMILRGVGVASMFLPLSIATLSPVPRSEIPAASGFYNLTRQVGGSLGIAVLATYVDRQVSIHRQNLVERLPMGGPNTMERLNLMHQALQFRGSSASLAGLQAYKILDLTVDVQAAVMSFADTFKFVGIFFIFCLPLILFLGNGKVGGPPPPSH